MAAISYVFTLSRVTEMLRVGQDRLDDLALEMEPERGCITVYGTDDLSTKAFTPDGIEYLKQLLEDQRT